MAESSSVTRAIDPYGDEIGAIKIGNTFYQAMTLVDENGNQVGLSGTPLNVTITGDSASVVALDNTTVNSITSNLESVDLNNSTIDDLTGSTINVTIDPSSIVTITANIESLDLNAPTITQLTGSVYNVGITGTPTVDLSHATQTVLTSSTSVVESKILGDNGTQIGVSANPLDVNIRSLFGSTQTAFGRLRTADNYTLADTVNRYDIDNRIWTTRNTLGGGVFHVPNLAAIALTASTLFSASSSLITLRNYRYQAGKGHFVEITGFLSNTAEPNCIRRWGFFDSQDGLGFGLSGTNFGVFARSSTGGVVAEYFINQSDFNLDKVDGTGKSGFNIDLTKANIFWISFQWLGVGAVVYGTVGPNGEAIPVHIKKNANANAGPYMASATLPVQYSIENVGTLGATAGIHAICQTVISEGGEPPPESKNSVANSDFITTTNGNEIPILSIRAKTNINGIRNKVETLLKTATLATETRPMIFRLRKNAVLTGASWQEVEATHSAIEWDESATVVAGGRVLNTKIVSANLSNELDLTDIFGINAEFIDYDNADKQETVTLTIQRTANQNGSGLGGLVFGEIR